MTGPLLCAVVDVAALAAASSDLDAGARALFAAGADWVQLRDREANTLRLLEAARALVAAREAAGTARRVIVNRRIDVAAAAGADGVHLGFDALDAGAARAVLGAGALIGASCHGAGEVRAQAARGDLDYVHLAPIWPPKSKPATRPSLGPEALASAAAHDLPVFAQGGVAGARAVEAIAAGAIGLAVTGALATGAPPEAVLAPPAKKLHEGRVTLGQFV